MKVVILAGGYGTRMSEITSVIPKPLVEVSGKPLLWYIMKSYANYGFNDFLIACGYKSEKIKEYFLNLQHTYNSFNVDLSNGRTEILKGKKLDWKVSLIDTGLNTMTGGRIKRLAEYIDGDTFMLTYGDGVSNVNIKELLKFHNSHGKKATITAVKMPRFGVVEVEKDGKVSLFREKRLDHSPLINGGFMVLSKSVISYIKNDETAFETTPMEMLSKEGELYAYKHTGFWKCVDTLKDRTELEELINENQEGTGVWKG